MNLFLLASIPLAALVLHRFLYSTRPAFSDPKAWILGSVWSILSLVAVAPFGKWREFGGDLFAVFAGLVWTDGVLVPGLVILAWVLTRRNRDPWELGLWLSLVFSMAGLRDFVATTRVFDLTEFFLVPLDRILLVLLLPTTVVGVLQAQGRWNQVLGWMASIGLILTGALFQTLSFGGWGLLVWVLVVGGIGLGLWWQKRPAGEPQVEQPEA